MKIKKCLPAGEASGKVRGSTKSLGFVLWGTRMSVPNFKEIHPIVWNQLVARLKSYRTSKCRTPQSRFYSSRACMNPLINSGPRVMLDPVFRTFQYWTSASSGWNGSWRMPSEDVIFSEICSVRNPRWKRIGAFSECNVTLGIPPVRLPPAGTARSSQTCWHNTAGPLHASSGHDQRRRLAKPHDESLPPEQRAGSRKLMVEVTAGRAAWCRGDKFISNCVLNMPCIIISIIVYSICVLWWLCRFFILSFKVFTFLPL